MTIESILLQIANYPQYVLLYLCFPPILSWVISLFYQESFGKLNFFDYLFSTLIYIVSIPGMFAAVITAYSLFFAQENLLKVNLLLYFVPIISMAISFFIIGRKVKFNRLPGFDRLSGLMVLIAITFIIVLLIYKTRIFFGFISSIQSFIIFGIILFAILKISVKKLTK